MTTAHQKREIVGGIISRVRFVGVIDIVDQLATLRRISLLLEDNFDDLRLEDVGVICSRMVLFVKDYNSSEVSPKARGESGYVFSWGKDNILRVTAPLNFKEWQFLQELENIHVYNRKQRKKSD